jgi:hypothetical protein
MSVIEMNRSDWSGESAKVPFTSGKARKDGTRRHTLAVYGNDYVIVERVVFVMVDGVQEHITTAMVYPKGDEGKGRDWAIATAHCMDDPFWVGRQDGVAVWAASACDISRECGDVDGTGLIRAVAALLFNLG